VIWNPSVVKKFLHLSIRYTFTMNRRDLLKTFPALALAPRPLAAAGKARMRTAICAYSFREELKNKSMSYDDIVRLAVDTGVDGLDLTVYWFPDLSDGFLLPLRRLAYKSGVEIYSISINTNMCQPTADRQSKEIAKVKEYVDAAAKLGAGHIRVFGGTVPKESTADQAAEWVREVLSRSAEYAGSKGVILGLENHGGITERADRIIQIVKQVDSPWVGINLDTGNFRADALKQIEMCLPYAVNVQVKAETRASDGSRQPQDWDRIIGMLAKSGYQGYLALEYEAKEPAPTAVPRLLKKLREVASKHSA
jgi:sugar phosphate isomerase/epimerase